MYSKNKKEKKMRIQRSTYVQRGQTDSKICI